LYEGVDAQLMVRPVNGLRLTLHPRGMAPRIANLAEWRAHLLSRLRRQIEITGDPVREELMKEALGYKYADAAGSLPGGHDLANAVLVPLKIHTSLDLLSVFSTTTVFGTPVDVTLSELAIEMFFPADASTAQAVLRSGAAPGATPN